MKKGLFSFIILLLLTNISYSFTGKGNELYLCSIYEKEEYNHYTYYFMLDTLQSRINVYWNDYGKVSLYDSLTICSDSSIVFFSYMEGFIRLNIKDGLIKSRTYQNGHVEGFSYDKDNHLISIRNEGNRHTFIWKNDSLVGFQIDAKMYGDSLSKFGTCQVIPDSPLCHATKSPELFCRMYDHHGFNEILFSMLGLYGEWPLTPDSYSIKNEHFGANSSHYIRDTKVSNTYTDSSILLETHSISRGSEHTLRFDWNFDNMNRIFDYRSKIKDPR